MTILKYFGLIRQLQILNYNFCNFALKSVFLLIFVFFIEVIMKISTVQFNPILFDKEYNIQKMLSLIENVKSDIIVFPELSTTGYFFLHKEEMQRYSDTFNSETIKIFQKLATDRNQIIVFGFLEEAKEHFYNSAAILFPQQKYSRIYRKTHLFYKEKFVFTPGDTGFVNINYPDWDLNIGTLICYDWRFPEATRTLALEGADIVVVPSNLVTKIWHRSMPARALDNHIYLAIANRIGTESRRDEELSFNGMSVIYDYYGEVLDLATPTEETIITAEFNHREARDKSINALNDIFTDRVPKYYFLG